MGKAQVTIMLVILAMAAAGIEVAVLLDHLDGGPAALANLGIGASFGMLAADRWRR